MMPRFCSGVPSIRLSTSCVRHWTIGCKAHRAILFCCYLDSGHGGVVAPLLRRANTGSALTRSPHRRARAELVHVIRPLFPVPAAVWLLRATSEAPLAARGGAHG